MKVYLKLYDYPNVLDLADAIKELVEAGFDPIIDQTNYYYPVYPVYPKPTYPYYPSTWTTGQISTYKGETYLINAEA